MAKRSKVEAATIFSYLPADMTRDIASFYGIMKPVYYIEHDDGHHMEKAFRDLKHMGDDVERVQVKVHRATRFYRLTHTEHLLDDPNTDAHFSFHSLRYFEAGLLSLHNAWARELSMLPVWSWEGEDEGDVVRASSLDTDLVVFFMDEVDDEDLFSDAIGARTVVAVNRAGITCGMKKYEKFCHSYYQAKSALCEQLD